jgi:hypothetical protein
MLFMVSIAAVEIFSAGASDQANVVRFAESGIRRAATSKPLPRYPPASLAAKRIGVAVAAVVSDPSGRMASVTILESPDEAIGAAVRDALVQWVVPAVTVSGRTEPFGVRGKITFYFRIVNGEGRVFHPEELPGGPKPEPPGGPPAGPPGASPAGRQAGPPAMTADHAVSSDIEIGDVEFARLQATAKPVVLDIRERDEFARGHRDGAINIPRDELPIRAYIELDRDRTVVIDCARTDTAACRNAATALRRGPKISRVFVLLP